MFRAKLQLDERANVEHEASLLRTRALRAGVKEAAAAQLQSEFIQFVGPMVDRGKQLRDQGSQLSIQRRWSGPGYVIDLNFGSARKTLMQSIVDTIRGR